MLNVELFDVATLFVVNIYLRQIEIRRDLNLFCRRVGGNLYFKFRIPNFLDAFRWPWVDYKGHAPIAPDGVLTKGTHLAEIEAVGAVAVEGRQDLRGGGGGEEEAIVGLHSIGADGELEKSGVGVGVPRGREAIRRQRQTPRYAAAPLDDGEDAAPDSWRRSRSHVDAW